MMRFTLTADGQPDPAELHVWCVVLAAAKQTYQPGFTALSPVEQADAAVLEYRSRLSPPTEESP